MSDLLDHVQRWQEECRRAGALLPERLMEEMEPAFRAAGYREGRGGADSQEKILLFNMNELGDSIIYSAFYRELRRAYPRAFITLLTKPRVYPMVELCPYFNRVLTVDISYADPPERNLPKILQLCRETLWKEHFTMAICSHWAEDKRSMNLLGYLSGAQERLGVSDMSYLAYVPDWQGEVGDDWECLLTHPIVTPAVLTHEAARALYAVADLGFEVQDDRLEVWFDERDAFLARQLLQGVPEHAVGIAVGIGAGSASRRYPVANYVEAMRQILAKGSFYFVVIGGPAERADGAWIEQQLPKGTVWNLAGKTEVRTTLAVLAQLQIYLGNDTGFKHASCALGLKIVEVSKEPADKTPLLPGLFSNVTRFGPWRAQAIVIQPEHALGACRTTLHHGGCCAESEPHCITQIPSEELACAVLRLLEK